MAELLQASDERPGLVARPRDDDLHAAGAASSEASATGSSPARRSTHRPSGSATRAVRILPSWWAAIGARQPPPIVATTARSAPTRRAVSSSPAAETSSSSPARTWSASAPWPASGSITSGSKRCPISAESPSRSSPHAARTTASRPRSPRLRRRVSMFPRSGSIESEGSSASSWALRRTEAVPMRMPGLMASAPQRASRGSSRSRYAPTMSPATSLEVMSFAECTATSMRPSSSASSSSLTNTPRSPIWPNGFERSRSPAVVIGTSAISIPERRIRSAASSACVSASLLPRLPILRSTLVLAEAEQVPRDLDVAGSLGRGGFLHTDDRDMEKLVHDLSRQRLDCPALALREAFKPPFRLRQLPRADPLRAFAQRRDRRDDVQARLPVAEPFRLLLDDRLRPLRLATAAAQALADDGLKVVDVVQVAVLEVGDGRIDVTRNGEVDHEERPSVPIRHVAPGQNLLRRAGRRDDHVGLLELAPEIAERHGARVEGVREPRRALLRPARHGGDRRSSRSQRTGGQLADLARADQQDTAAGQLAEDLLGESARSRGNRRWALGDRCLGANLLSDAERLA